MICRVLHRSYSILPDGFRQMKANAGKMEGDVTSDTRSLVRALRPRFTAGKAANSLKFSRAEQAETIHMHTA